ncbi:rRNA maturation RNase YbeY [Bdellovibrio bacteriovorus]|uniref:Endoribonuclease YbeY n=1 Tax=Bdellovibrio bacteriovorus (strain ATCC 15356 / DSM 50701 / NCIMB 9529 / HD100) TaxID=264462 RepID=YBEY_BDEBA|nr:rRNA maturation RNase YbeY [Bdellovibrio bacteriovorus]Q6MMY3.1 RecName: Full=Endoribonuclease YbeY [Bdellovibrio bacteriovorus HD100]AHZ84042.1 rRNA maturation factor [Bdellovibrio bacteriovorus]BEV67925.1 Endoribonuclease YbeY [Bdellovibrio bacteriovorus]CAE79370.1 metal-dependent hydrolase, putative [Bdellovibrio bacteriovorus HD100]
MEVLIVNESKHAAPRKFIQTWMQLVVTELKRKKVLKAEQARRELTLVFLDKKPAQKINMEFRGKNYATDVLSFDSMDPGSLGELVLCPEVLKRQSKEHGLTYQQELGYMLLHGVLHLLGYDHETSEAEALEMFGIQDAAFEVLLKKVSAK